MKKILAVLLCCAMILTSCSSQKHVGDSSFGSAETGAAVPETHVSETAVSETGEIKIKEIEEVSTEYLETWVAAETAEETKGDQKTADSEKQIQTNIHNEASRFRSSSLDNPELLRYVEDAVYAQLVEQLDSDGYFVENVEAIYISKEYLDELAYNSQENIFFGYTLSQLEQLFQGTKYVFTLGNDGQTIVQPLEEYDATFDEVIKNVAVGTGVILLCVTVSVVSGGMGAPAVSMIFAESAKSAVTLALSSGTLAGVAAGTVEGIQTHDFEKAIKAAAISGSEGYKWGAFSGAVSGGMSEAIALKGATLHGLTMNEAATIQKESRYPLDVIKEFRNMEQFEICKDAGLTTEMVSGKTALIRNIDLDFMDSNGLTNLERMRLGKPALDPSGVPYELHHIGQKADSTLAILTRTEHRLRDNHKIWHIFDEPTKVYVQGNHWGVQKAAFWRDVAAILAP